MGIIKKQAHYISNLPLCVQEQVCRLDRLENEVELEMAVNRGPEGQWSKRGVLGWVGVNPRVPRTWVCKITIGFFRMERLRFSGFH